MRSPATPVTKPPKRLRLIEAFENPPQTPAPKTTMPQSHGTHLPSLNPSDLRPPCSSGERIQKWKPVHARNVLDEEGQPTNISEDDLQRISEVLKDAYAPNTRCTYGTGLLVFHIFCDKRNIEEKHRAPVHHTVLASFISTLAGTYGGSSIRNYVYGIRAWHLIHGIRWSVNEDELDALFAAGKKIAPKESRKEQKKPWTLEYLSNICSHLDLDDPKDAAILACVTTAFWGTARLGEVTVPKLSGFDPARHVKPADVQQGVRDRNDLEETVIFLPWTKAAKEKGETIFWAKQNGITDPKAALNNHLRINNPPEDSHLFSFKHKNERRPMTRSIFLTRINKIATENRLTKLPGHGIRIGSTLEYLLRGVPFDVVKAKGRWQSEAFLGYLRKHAQIMAPYMQKDPNVYDTFIRYAMPPVR